MFEPRERFQERVEATQTFLAADFGRRDQLKDNVTVEERIFGYAAGLCWADRQLFLNDIKSKLSI